VPGTADPPVTERVLDPAETSWWAGYAPADDPEITVVVAVPGGGRGEETAEAVARSILMTYSQLKAAGVFHGR
jgi:cell division protein FtsI/penicillin-binding protein 2